jgi:hypothetical protein
MLSDLAEQMETLEDRLDALESGSTLTIDLDDEKVQAVLERYSKDDENG